MPSKSKKQAHLMAAIAHGWKPPAGSGVSVPVKVAKEFNEADKGRACYGNDCVAHHKHLASK